MKKQIRSVVVAVIILSIASVGFARWAKGFEPRSAPIAPMTVEASL